MGGGPETITYTCNAIMPPVVQKQKACADHPRAVHGEGEQRGGPLQAGPQQRQRHLQGHHRQQQGQYTKLDNKLGPIESIFLI